MRILFFGDGPWAHNALKDILESGDFIVMGVVLRYETQDPVLKSIAENNNIPVHVEENVNCKEFIELCKSLNLDLNISMSFNQIIRAPLRFTARYGFINCHAGKLPYYRGRNIINWAIINDEKEIGITVHYIDDGIDTGDIISQVIIPITEEDNYKTLLDKAISICPKALLDAMYKIKLDKVNVIKQSHLNGTYFSYRREGDEFINWNWSSRRIHNFIRALVAPSPGAQTVLDNKKVFIWESEEVDFPNYISSPGEIILNVEDGIIVKTGDNAIKIKKISYEVNRDIHIPRILVGKRFGINVYSYLLSLENRIRQLEESLNKTKTLK